MIRHTTRTPEKVVTTSRAHVEAVAERHDLPVIPAGPWLYVVRRVPLFRQPLIYRCRVEVRHG